MQMIDFAIRNLLQRKTRSLLTALGIGAVIMLYLWSTSITEWYDRDLRQQMSGMAGKVVVRAKSEDQTLYANTVMSQVDARAVMGLAGADGERSTPVLLETLVASQAPGMPPLVQAVGILPGREQAFIGDAGVTGSGALQGPTDVILGVQAAEKYGKKPGEDLEIQGQTYRVVGVIEKTHQMVDSAVMMPLDTAQQVFVRPEVVSQVYLVATSADEVEQLAAAVTKQNSRLEAMTAAGMARTAEKMLEGMQDFFRKIKSAAIVVAVVVIVIVMNMAISERRREIGTLKAIGASAGKIVSMVMIEAVILSLIGGLLAIPASIALSEGEPLDLMVAAQAVLLSCVLGAVAALWPAWNSVRVDPLESLRYE